MSIINGRNPNDRMYIMKFIESYYLGMNFLGHLPSYNIIEDIDIPQNRAPPVNVTTNYNMYSRQDKNQTGQCEN